MKHIWKRGRHNHWQVHWGNFKIQNSKSKCWEHPWITCNIVDKSDEALPSNADSKVSKEYKRHMKKANSIINLNPADNQLAHMKICKGPVEVWTTLCNIYKTKFVQHYFFFVVSSSRVTCNKTTTCWTTSKMLRRSQINMFVWMYSWETKTLSWPYKNIVMTLLKNLSLSYNNLITTLEMIPMKQLPIDCMMARLMHKILHLKEK